MEIGYNTWTWDSIQRDSTHKTCQWIEYGNKEQGGIEEDSWLCLSS